MQWCHLGISFFRCLVVTPCESDHAFVDAAATCRLLSKCLYKICMILNNFEL